MTRHMAVVVGILLMAALVLPAAAFTSDALNISVEGNGDTEITFDYSLSWIENIAVFLKITDPADELKKALEGHSDKSVEVQSVSDGSATFLVEEFVRVKRTDNQTTYITPELSFKRAEKVLKEYWFAPLIHADFSPEETTISFPDGHEKQFQNQIEIPEIRYTIS